MKITLVIGALTFGGAERVLTNLANYLSGQGDDVTLITIKKRDPVYDISKKITFINGIKGENKLAEIYNLRKKIMEIQPSIVLSFLTQINIATLLATIGLDVPVIISERNDPKSTPVQRYRKILRKFLYPLANGFVFQTKGARDYFSKKIISRSTIIPNPIFINTKAVNIEKRNKEIVSIGRLVPQKRHHDMIKAFKKIEKGHPEYILSIYGEGSEREYLQDLIFHYKLEKKVYLKGTVSNIHDKIKKAEIFVLTSEFEGMPNALMESMALGLACVSTDSPSGGPRFLINNYENGILVPIGDVSAISKAIEFLINNPQKRFQISRKALKIYNDINPDDINKSWRSFLINQIK